MIKTLGDVLRTAAQSRPLVMAVAAAQDEAVLTAVHLAAEHGLVKPLLVGDKTGIIHIAQKDGGFTAVSVIRDNIYKRSWAFNDDYRISIYLGVSSTLGASFGT